MYIITNITTYVNIYIDTFLKICDNTGIKKKLFYIGVKF